MVAGGPGDAATSSSRVPPKVGYTFVHTAIDSHTRLAYSEVLGDEKAVTAIGFCERAPRLVRRPRDHHRGRPDRQRLVLQGASRSPPRSKPPERAIIDSHPAGRNGTAKSNASTAPCSTNGPTSASTDQNTARTRALDRWLHLYNHHRAHTASAATHPSAESTTLLGSTPSDSEWSGRSYPIEARAEPRGRRTDDPGKLARLAQLGALNQGCVIGPPPTRSRQQGPG